MDPLERRAEEAQKAGDFQVAFELWRELAEKNPERYFLLKYGRAAQELHRWEEAEAAYLEALYREPESSLVMENLGQLWALREDKEESLSFKVAKGWFLKALERNRSARTLTLLGSVCKALRDPMAAKEAWEEAIRLDPRYEEALCNLADLLEQTDAERAIELLELAIQVDPTYLRANQILGIVYHKKRDFGRAEFHFRRCLEIDPADYWSQLYLANLLGVLGQNTEAERLYRAATSAHPEILNGIEIFANFLESTGREEEASAMRSRL